MTETTVVRIVDWPVLRLNSERMNRSTSPGSRALRWLLLSIVALAPLVSPALTVLPFTPLRVQVTNEIDALQTLPDPSNAERKRLRALNKANDVFSSNSISDGKALRTFKNTLGRYPEYAETLDTVASNLVAVYNNEYDFVGSLLLELPPSPEATAINAQYSAHANTAAKLNADITAKKTSALYDAAKRRLDSIFARANQALLIPFPNDLVTNQAKAKIDVGAGPKNFTATSSSSDLNVLQAVRSGDTISLTINVVESTRGLAFAIPNVQLGTARYEIPSDASFAYRTDFDFFAMPPTSTDTAATNGTIFVSTTATEVFGTFECSGPGFNITGGRFRVNITTP
jgi:hypothetical protein